MKKLFELFVCMLLVSTFFIVVTDTVRASWENGYFYTLSNGEATITGYNGTDRAITIPSTLGGYPTLHIGNSAFAYCSNLTSVTIPNSVTTIEDNAFTYCTTLASVTIGNSVTTIGNSSFSYCTVLTSVTIPNSVTTIEDNAFNLCTNLTSVTIGNNVTTIGSFAFNCFSLTSITFLGVVAPTTVEQGWIENTPAEIRGHAYSNSNFPAPGSVWHNLTMGEYIGSENKPPTAAFTWTPSTPKANQTITFDASASTDIDGTIVKYEWDWNNDGTYENSFTTATATHTWAQAGIYPVTLRVTDNGNATITKTYSVSVSSGGGSGTTNKGTPGFELIFVIGAIVGAMFLWRKKRII